MKAEALLALYERVADAPDAIARLRRFVLDLAVRGKLVEQDAGDEPASELLARIIAEHERPLESGAIKEPRSAQKIERSELPFHPPEHWAWIRLIELARVSYGFAFESARFNGDKRGMPLIRIRDISRSDTEAYFDGDFDPAYVVRHGDYLVGMDGDFNLRRWSGGDALLNQRVLRINDWRCGVAPEFVRLPLSMVLDHVHGSTSQTTVKHLSAKQVNAIEIPLAPLAEQHRIVAKVDELMALLNRLEAVRSAREATRDCLTTASLTRLTADDNAPEALRTHGRFALDALPALTARADQIRQLRQTILSLAMRGKLVEQDEADEPAAVALQGFRSAQQIGGTAKKSRAVQGTASSMPLTESSTPSGWVWTTLGVVGSWGSGSTPSRSQADYYGGGYTWLKSGELGDSMSLFGSAETVTEKAMRECSFRLNQPGDVLIAMYGATIGKLAILAEPAVTNQAVCGCTPHPFLLNRYLFLFLLSNRSSFQGASEGGAQPNISKIKIVNTAIPLPPLAEQHRIVAKVDELMALCARLEAALQSADTTRARLLEGLLHEALTSPADNVIDFAEARARLRGSRAEVGSLIVDRLSRRGQGGRTKIVKSLYLAEAHCGLGLGGQWGRSEYGPLDEWIYAFEREACHAGWFSVSERPFGDGKLRAEYTPGPALAAKAEETYVRLGEHAAELERVLDLLAPLTAEEAEIAATLFAAWNDLLLEGAAVSDEAIITEVRERWHTSKGRFMPAVLQQWLGWLRKHQLIPRGQGPNTRHQAALL